MGLPYWLHRLTPQTRSWPLMASGVVPVGGGGVVVVGGGVGVCVCVGVGVAVRGGVGVEVTDPEHVTPLTVNCVGTGLLPLHVPLKPKLAVPPVRTLPL